ncbi:MAG: biotin transporter BioY, partial [Burkholderiales bacterium]
MQRPFDTLRWGTTVFLLFAPNLLTLGAQAQNTPLTGVQQLAAGFSHTCALTTGGGLKCWGNNEYGQLGDNSAVNRLTPADVVGLSGVTEVAAGGFHTCALLSNG